MKNKTFAKLFGYTLRTKRNHYQLTQEQVAEKLNISTRWYQKIECGTSVPNLQLAFMMVKMFNINTSSLISEVYVYDYSEITN